MKRAPVIAVLVAGVAILVAGIMPALAERIALVDSYSSPSGTVVVLNFATATNTEGNPISVSGKDFRWGLTRVNYDSSSVFITPTNIIKSKGVVVLFFDAADIPSDAVSMNVHGNITPPGGLSYEVHVYILLG